MDEKKGKKSITLTLVFLLGSLLLHLMGFYSFVYFNDFLFLNELYRRLDHKIVDKTKDLVTQIELVDLKEDQKQFVEQSEKSVNEETPEKYDFISRNDQNVKKQTKARNNGEFKNNKGNAAPPSKSTPPVYITAQEAMLLEQKDTDPSKITKEEKLGIQGLKASRNQTKITQKIQEKRVFAFQPPQPQSAGSGPSQTDDFLKDITEGDFTVLRTKRFKFYSFFSRVKGQLRSHWNPLIREEVSFIYATRRSVSSLGIRRTSLKVTLNSTGYLEEIALIRTSGNQKIDHAAIQAFRLAAPFLNPPKELLEKDKKIRIFWDFVLES